MVCMRLKRHECQNLTYSQGSETKANVVSKHHMHKTTDLALANDLG